jgi:hypothetical protein
VARTLAPTEEEALPEFVPGVDLARAFYWDAVRPVLDARFPSLVHAAALIGPGSEVLGYDTERSTDHHWGPRVLLFVEPGPAVADLLAVLGDALPTTFRGWSTNWGAPDEIGVRLLVDVDEGPVAHRVDVHEAKAWFEEVLGFDPAAGVSLDDWLGTPTQLLLAVTAGEVFDDPAGLVTSRREQLAWYPDDVWRYVLGCQWQRVAREESFVGRAGEVRDDLGSRVVAARVVRDLMRLCFLIERRYPPYSKWLGRAFAQLSCAHAIGPHLAAALSATTWHRREAEIGAAAERVGALHNALGITVPVDATLRPFHDRPFLVLDAQRFADACFTAIVGAEVAALTPGVGAVDQWVDSTDVLGRPLRSRGAARAARAWCREPD